MGVIFLFPDSPCARDQRDEQEWDERAQITPSKAAFTPPQIKREYRRQYHRRWLARDCGGETEWSDDDRILRQVLFVVPNKAGMTHARISESDGGEERRR